MRQSISVVGFWLAAVVAIVGGCAFCPDAWAEYAPEAASREDRFANPPASARMLPIWHDWKNSPAAWRRGLDRFISRFGLISLPICICWIRNTASSRAGRRRHRPRLPHRQRRRLRIPPRRLVRRIRGARWRLFAGQKRAGGNKA